MAYQDESIKDGDFKNGKMSFPELIAEALDNAPNGELVISDIFKSINLRHPQYKLEDMRWQNTVRGAISRNKDFAKATNKANNYQQYWKFSQAYSILAPKVVHEGKLQKSNNTKPSNLEKMRKDISNSESDEELSGYEKPSMSYAQLIAEAINSAPEKALVLSDIYKAISANYPYYALESQGWQNSIRHNLKLKNNFIKANKSGLADKCGRYWKLSEDHVKRLYMCSHCDKDFSSIGGLNYHYYAVHEGKFKKSGDSDGALSDNTKYNNPWLVENIQAFSYLNCPECTFKVKEENLFQDHAVKNHSSSSVLFGANITTECVYIKTEPNEDFIEYNMVDKELNQDITEHNMIETEPNEDITEHQMIQTEPDEDIMEQHIIKTELNEDTTEPRIIDLLDNVVVDKKIETVEELAYPDFEKLENTESPNRNRKSSRSNLGHRFQCPYCDSQLSSKSSMKNHVNFMHNDLLQSTDFSQMLPFDIQNKAEESVGIKHEAVNDSFSNKPIKLIFKPTQLKRTIGTVGTNITIEVPYKMKKDDSNSEPDHEDHEELINPDFEKSENTESPNKNRKSSRSNLAHRFQCPYCDSQFTQKSSLKIHVNFNHEDLVESTDFSQILPISNEILASPAFDKKPSTSRPSNLKRSYGTNDTIQTPESPSKKMKDNSFSVPDEGDTSHKKPYLSFAQLIAEALNNALGKTLVLSDIYKAINAKYPYYKLETQGWQNSIRHNLTLNKYFIKGNKASGFLGKDEKRGWYWKLSTDVPKALLETKQKYSANKRKCEFCHKDFETRLALNQHIQESHLVESETSNADKQYKCDICNVFIAYHKNEIKLHRKSCENRKIVKQVPKKDNVNKFFITNENGKEIFSCSKCGLTFSGFNGTHIINCWNIQSDKTEELL